jgi:hypothetical protein
MPEYIEREIAKKVLADDYAYAAAKLLDTVPTADVAEVKHGKWIKVADLCGVEVLKCSVCGTEHPRIATAFCCDCNAKMDKE